MSALAHARESNTPQSVTTISVNARVDYILRFSKHAVLVVDQDPLVYSQVASQFIGSLANDHNAAFVAISSKLNDIQIRCRIVEQLFTDSLFDPEQSLAVSLINLAKQEQNPIDIVIEHAQYLSLQIIHELCQLTDIAKKANYAISVLMLGTLETGTLLANNKSLFNKKISILSAKTGQLVSLSDKIFKRKSSFWKLTRFNKWLIIFISFTVSMAAMSFWLYQQNVFSVKTKLGLQDASLDPKSFISTTDLETSDLAKNSDIFISLTAPEQQVMEAKKQLLATPADAKDIINALVNFGKPLTVDKPEIKEFKRPKRFQSFLDEKIISTAKVISTVKPESDKVTIGLQENTNIVGIKNLKASPVKTDTGVIEKVNTDRGYYIDAQSGFVVQIAGFTQLSMYQNFLSDFDKISVKRYYRLLENQAMLVITSEVYQTRAAAEQAISLLPNEIMVHQPWIKSVEAINNEINAYQRSQ
jgi:DamX protein